MIYVILDNTLPQNISDLSNSKVRHDVAGAWAIFAISCAADLDHGSNDVLAKLNKNMLDISFELIGLVLCTTIFLSMLLVPMVSGLARKIGAIDVPRSRSSHITPRTRMGGVAMALSLAVACISYLPMDNFLKAFLSGLAVIVLTGVIDDVHTISPRWKFAGQFLAAFFFIYLSGMKIEYLGDITGLGGINLGEASFIFTAFCLVGGINAFNFADGLDGLAGGLSVIAAAFFGYFAWHIQNEGLLIIAVSIIGAIIGFLRFNSYPAKVFMGDSGSLMLGYVVGVLLVALAHSSTQLQIANLAMVVALPLLDALVVIGWRIYCGHSPFTADRAHLHHRLLDIGLPHPAVVSVIYGIMLVFGLLAFALKEQPGWMVFLTLMGSGLLIFSCVPLAQKAGVGHNKRAERKAAFADQAIAPGQIAQWLKLNAKPVGILILAALMFPSLIVPLLALNTNHLLVLYCAMTLLVIYSWYTAAPDSSFLQGTMYVTVFALLLHYNLTSSVNSFWLEYYINTVSVITLLWVLVYLAYDRQNEILFPSGFELIMLFFAWFVPFVILNELQLPANVLKATQRTCLLSIPYMLVIKIMIRNSGGAIRWLSLPLIIGLAMVAIRWELYGGQ